MEKVKAAVRSIVPAFEVVFVFNGKEWRYPHFVTKLDDIVTILKSVNITYREVIIREKYIITEKDINGRTIKVYVTDTLPL
jgi:hypothetical protein